MELLLFSKDLRWWVREAEAKAKTLERRFNTGLFGIGGHGWGELTVFWGPFRFIETVVRHGWGDETRMDTS